MSEKKPSIWLDVVVWTIVLAALFVLASAFINAIQSGRWPEALTL